MNNSYTAKEELFNTLTHAIGVIFGFIALSVLVCLSSVYANVWSIVSCSIFGLSIILAYSASTSYHAVRPQSLKKLFKKLDHIAIYYLIAGSYTPFILVCMRTHLGCGLLICVWVLAILGTIFKLCLNTSGTKFWSIGLYLGMGWISIFVIKHFFIALTLPGIIFLVLGGLFYTAGVPFYMNKKRAYSHAVWHLFVLLGTIMHFFAVLFSCVFI